MISALIVDDEPLARRRIRRLIRTHADTTVAGDCGTAHDAIALARELQPDVLFLDVQMPDLDGFAVLEALGRKRPAVVVFTTAFDDYAVRAFEVNAVDYLTKPISRARFDSAMERSRLALSRNNQGETDARIRAALAQLANPPVVRLVVKRDGRSLFVDPADISWVEADHNGVRLHTTSGVFRYADSLTNLEAKLDPARFVRVHRSSLVNIERVAELQPWFHGDGILIMQGGARVTLSRTHRARLSTALKQAL